MKKLTLLAFGLAFLAVPLAAQSPEEKQVMATLEALSKATVTPDQKMVASLIHENISYGHTSGEVMNKAEAVHHVLGRKTSVWKWDNPKVTIVGTTAIVRAKQTVEYIDPTTKKPMASSSNVIWVLTKGGGPHGWLILLRQNFRTPGRTT
jgi:hypothetical protein